MPLSLFKQQVDISHLNTMAVPCVAEYYIEITNDLELVAAIEAAQNNQLDIHILGGGSNVLCRPFICGLVLVPAIKGIDVQSIGDEVLVTVNAGENWHELVTWSLANQYYGLENLALIPGSVGASPIQNIGAYGVELADVLESVRWLDCKNHDFYTYMACECELGYRDSIFKHALKGRAVISQVTLRLNKQANPIVHYKPLADFFHNKPVTPQCVFDEVCAQRNRKLPNPKYLPNSGSFFKNPIMSTLVFEQLCALVRRDFELEVPHYLQADGTVKVPAAWLIDRAGLKGADINGLKVHEMQALVLTNPQAMPLNAVLYASDQIVETVRRRFGVTLHREPQILG